jgi:hypothetical protein
VTLAVLGGVLPVGCIPTIVLLPEPGVPALLVASRLLAVEADWAARAQAWTDWRFSQMRLGFLRQSRFVRMAILTSLLLAAEAIVIVFVYEFF